MNSLNSYKKQILLVFHHTYKYFFSGYAPNKKSKIKSSDEPYLLPA